MKPLRNWGFGMGILAALQIVLVTQQCQRWSRSVRRSQSTWAVLFTSVLPVPSTCFLAWVEGNRALWERKWAPQLTGALVSATIHRLVSTAGAWKSTELLSLELSVSSSCARAVLGLTWGRSSYLLFSPWGKTNILMTCLFSRNIY